jgi:uncharacterized protein YggU (UPF0235/DUF167 family)
MIGREFKFHDGKKGAALAVRIIKNSDIDAIEKVLMDGTVVVHLKGNPDDPKGNLLEFLSSELSIGKDRFDVIEGKDGIDVLLSILDIEPSEIQKIILDNIS